MERLPAERTGARSKLKSSAQPAVVGPWAKDKLDALQRYLDYYTKVLKNQRWRTIYVDAFAGGGRAVVRAASGPDLGPLIEENEADTEQVELINGSPRVALDVANPFTRYVFIEPNAARAAELEALKNEYRGTRQVDVRQENANAGIDWLVSQNISRRGHRGIAFLDPFGAGLDWETLQKLADTGLFEVVINFALNMAMQRMLPNSGVFQAGWRERLDSYFGTDAWFGEVYEEKSGLFGRNLEKRADYLDRLLKLYGGRLKKAFGFVSQPRLVRNSRGSPLYYLLWAGPHQKGLQGANYILGMGNRGRRTQRARS
jgi:three-Cys-motif partner protein